MRIIKPVALLMLIVVTSVAFAAVEKMPLTLKECYKLALVRSESIGIQKELIKETEGLMLQSLSTALPKAVFAYSQKWQDVRPNDTFGGYQPEARFTFTQPLFTGFKEFAAIKASKHIGKQRAEELRRAEQLLFIDVSDAFYLYLTYQKDLIVRQEVRKILRDRIEELKKREALGKSRSSEVSSAEAKLFRTEANIVESEGQKEVVCQLLEFLIGRPFDALADEELSEEHFDLASLAVKVDERPDVVAARETLASSKNNITAARSSFFPTVSLTGNSYTKRSDTNEGNDWDATVSVNVPLFNGMSDHGQVAQARAQANEAALRLSQVRRTALLEIKNAYVKLESARQRSAALLKAVLASDKNYRLQAGDFQRNLVNNLDVLQALEDLQSDRRDHVAAVRDAGRAFWALKVATGEDLK